MYIGPDITFMNKKTKNTFLIDIAVPNTHNLTKTINDNQNKYQELANKIGRWEFEMGNIYVELKIIFSPFVLIFWFLQLLVRIMQ
jgi:hypothetical protein